uniref:Transmembrane protein n=1 Tax=Steinernema glaseri TaxID=37863 RepID=A0A1I8A460_9BILA
MTVGQIPIKCFCSSLGYCCPGISVLISANQSNVRNILHFALFRNLFPFTTSLSMDEQRRKGNFLCHADAPLASSRRESANRKRNLFPFTTSFSMDEQRRKGNFLWHADAPLASSRRESANRKRCVQATPFGTKQILVFSGFGLITDVKCHGPMYM